MFEVEFESMKLSLKYVSNGFQVEYEFEFER